MNILFSTIFPKPFYIDKSILLEGIRGKEYFFEKWMTLID